MAKGKVNQGLSSGAGLISYMDEDLSKFRIGPEKVLGITISIMVLLFVLNYKILV